MKIRGCFILWGADRAPEVHQLTKEAMELMDRRERLSTLQTALDATFGPGFQCRIPAWVDGATEFIALKYEGPHQERVRGLCAAINSGTPYGGPEPGQRPHGGSKDRMPVQPKSPRSPRGRQIIPQAVGSAA